MLDNAILKNFVTNTDDTGRFIVFSKRTGKRYFVEPIDDRQKTDWTQWGSIDPATGKMMNKQGFRKYHGAVSPEESLITPENGFENITLLDKGTSPLAYIDMIDAKYPSVEVA